MDRFDLRLHIGSKIEDVLARNTLLAFQKLMAGISNHIHKLKAADIGVF
jgi:hypothetical protein